MKFAFITPFATGNVGTALQAYATQELLFRAGYDSAIINYVWKSIEHPFRLENLKNRGLKTYLMAIAGYLLRLPKRRGYERFVSRFRLTRRVEKEQLGELQSEYDFFLAGSDCIWNASSFGIETAFFLDFVENENRIGNYASSFAMDAIPDALRETYTKYLSRFPMLSVREENALDFVRSLTGKEATLVLDPTLALDAAFWSKIADESSIHIQEPYLFVAEYSRSKRLWNDALALSKKFGWKIVSVYPPKGKFARAQVLNQASPQDFLQLIRNAAYVLTDSYHMTIFSINFGRPFLTYVTGIASSTMSKYESILGLLGIEGRLAADDGSASDPLDIDGLSPIDYSAVAQKLGALRETSDSYLSSVLDRATEWMGKSDAKKQ